MDIIIKKDINMDIIIKNIIKIIKKKIKMIVIVKLKMTARKIKGKGREFEKKTFPVMKKISIF